MDDPRKGYPTDYPPDPERQSLNKHLLRDLARFLWGDFLDFLQEFFRPKQENPPSDAPDFSGDRYYMGPRGGRYRIDSRGRKVYDAPP